MNKKELELLLHKIGWEGFDYCFSGYSDWKEIKDEKFHELRKNYLKSIKQLNEYLQDKCEEFDLDFDEMTEEH